MDKSVKGIFPQLLIPRSFCSFREDDADPAWCLNTGHLVTTGPGPGLDLVTT